MSAGEPDALKAVAAQTQKASTAREKGRFPEFSRRSAQALEAARPHCAPDTSLILAHLLMSAHYAQHVEAKERSEQEGADFRGVGHLEEAVAILARRHAAGTLVPSLPDEQRFFERSAIAARVRGSNHNTDVFSPFGGYLDHITACTFLMKRLLNACVATVHALGHLVPPPQELQMSASVQAAYEHFTLAGLDLMRDVHDARLHPGWPSATFQHEELTLIRGLQQLSAAGGQAIPGTWVAAMLRKFREGRFAERGGFTNGGPSNQIGQRSASQMAANRAADVAKHGLQRCGLASCGAAEAHPRHFKRCAKCNHGSAAYCCKEHQAEHWHAGHRQTCKALRPQAAPADE